MDSQKLNNEENEPCDECDKSVKKVLKSGLEFVESKTDEVAQCVESGLETLASPFEKCVSFIKDERRLIRKLQSAIGEFYDLTGTVCVFTGGQSNINEVVTFFIWLLFCYKCEVWMIPLLIPLVFLKQFIFIYLSPSSLCGETEEKDDDEEGKSLADILGEVHIVTQKVQTSVDTLDALLRTIRIALNFENPQLTFLIILMSMVATVLLYYISLRYLFIIVSSYWFLHKFSEDKKELSN